MGNRKTINKRKGNNKTTNNFYQREERGENQKNLVKFEKDVQQKFIDIEENINNVEKEIKAEKKSNVFSNIVNVVLVIVSIISIIMSSCNNMKTIKENRDLNKKTIEESRILNKQTVEMSKKIADRDYKLAESNQSLVIKEECTLEMVGDNINMDFTIEQGQPIATYLAINNSDNDQLFIKRMYPQIKNNTISISLPFVLEEDEAKENGRTHDSPKEAGEAIEKSTGLYFVTFVHNVEISDCFPSGKRTLPFLSFFVFWKSEAFYTKKQTKFFLKKEESHFS